MPQKLMFYYHRRLPVLRWSESDSLEVEGGSSDGEPRVSGPVRLTFTVTTEEAHQLSEPWFPNLQNGDNNSNPLRGMIL